MNEKKIGLLQIATRGLMIRFEYSRINHRKCEQGTANADTHSATLNIEHLYPSLYRTFAKHIFKTIYKRKTVCQKANGNVVCEMCCDDSMQSESNKSISTPRHRLSPVGERGIGILKIELMCKWEKISGTSFTIKRTDEKKKPNPN